jgi:hypothetical protein
MTPLVVVDPSRQAAERRQAELADAAWSQWRRSWRRVYAQCIVLFALGAVLFAASWGLTDRAQVGVVLAGSVIVSYVLPLARLLAFFLRHSEQF